MESLESLESLEIEVKFYIADRMPQIREHILALGAKSLGRVFESNIRFEDEEQSLKKRNCLLRLRKDSKAKLTFKSEPLASDSQFKIRRELEVEVSDFSKMNRILEALGFREEQVYEKWREDFVLDSTLFCVDIMPYGNFLEIEGEKENIRPLAERIGLQWEERILTGYLGIFAFIRQQLNLPFSDLTFDNFKTVSADFGKYIEKMRSEQ